MVDKTLLAHYGPVALVTGASSGIGASYARLLAAAGFDLVVTARRVDRLNELAEQLQADHQVNVTTLAVDLTDPTAADVIADSVASLDIGLVINNAGFGLKGPHQQQDAKTLSDMVQVNCVAPMQLCHRLVPALVARGRGGLLFTGSVEGIMGFPNSSAYSGSKGFIQNFGESLWGELESKNIDVLVLAPSSTDTEAIDKQGVDRSKLDGMMSADEVAQIGLDNLKNGPVLVAGEENAAAFKAISDMPRPDALRILAQSMLDSLATD